MKKITFKTTSQSLLADVYTPVGIYLRLRDNYRDSILLESSDNKGGENSFSIIAVNAVAGIEIDNGSKAEIKLPGHPQEKIAIEGKKTTDILYDFLQKFEAENADDKISKMACGVFGYCSYDAVQLFEQISFRNREEENIPMVRYRLYQYVIIIDHFRDELHICENHFNGVDSDLKKLISLIKGRDVPLFPFHLDGALSSPVTDKEYMQMVEKGIDACNKGEVFQVVLSRKFHQQFLGDDFLLYRALRSTNPSPYLFYFDYGDYHIAGSSPEAQVIVNNGKAIMHPIAGTVLRSANDAEDQERAKQLVNDEKENAEHVMLIDLARNDLSRIGDQVKITKNREVQYFSHVIHMVSEVVANVPTDKNPFDIIAATFPAGTLSGAPKYRAMQLIDEWETEHRGSYGGVVGFIGLNGDVNHAIIIRSFFSKDNKITLQAGAGVVAKSKPESELQEVNNKIAALKTAMEKASLMGLKN